MKAEFIYKKAPHIIQNILISIFNFVAYKKRYGGKYRDFRKKFSLTENLSREELQQYQSERFIRFIKYARERSDYYKKLYSVFNDELTLKDIKKLPIIKKENLRTNIDDIRTIEVEKAIVSKTGGTTGKSLEVYYTKNDMQERFAILDHFRSKFGYKLGKRTAWFSGKDILTPKDINKNRYWKTDILYRVRYYSTFHIQMKTVLYYLNNLVKFDPEYLVGFPSSMKDIAKYAIANDIEYTGKSLKAIFPTAESLDTNSRKILETFFKAPVLNQYASSEGAPFITECSTGNLHLELQSGVFEVLDNNNRDAAKGRLIITSFTTHGTPLIRYDIGDDIELQEGTCNCGNNSPLVKQIIGRSADYIFSNETGKIYLGNISNATKDVRGIQKFQVIQTNLNKVKVLVVKDQASFTPKEEKKFLKNLTDRFGSAMEIELNYLHDIDKEKSGKFRIVKNEIKHLLDT